MDSQLAAKVMLVDDEEEFIELMSQRLETRGLKVTAVTSGEEALTMTDDQNIDVAVVDFAMPGINGIEATGKVKDVFPNIQIVILTVSEQEGRIFNALQNGATGYLLKKSSPEDILDAVMSVTKGGSPMSPAIARKVLQYFRQN